MSVPKDPPDYGYYPERMRPVPFPTASAQAAIAVCDRIAALLESDLGARPGLVAGARDGWEGAYRVEFDETWRIQEVRLAGLKEDLRRLSGQITTAVNNAAAINGQRATARANYLAEQQSETSGAGAN
ncbi:MAG TPA: hypothetical protein VKB57_08860 [Acidimicrobiales bacterium]|nr:hypothetical protein [Acidimicrobiales bacterium]